MAADDFASLFVRPGKKRALSAFDPADTHGWNEEDSKKRLDELQSRLSKLQSLFFADGRFALLIVLQGMDTSGKDGTIRNVMQRISPLGVQVTAFKTPNGAETKHDFLWRVHQAVPPRGVFGIFNRSHYEDYLYPSVFGGLSALQLGRRITAIKAFEESLHEEKVRTLKFFLHISKPEQKRRLQARLTDPSKQWKFSMDDLTSRKKWGPFMKSYEHVIQQSSSTNCPWIVVPADHKWFRNLVVAEVIVRKLEELKLKFPKNIRNLKTVKIV